MSGPELYAAYTLQWQLRGANVLPWQSLSPTAQAVWSELARALTEQGHTLKGGRG